MPLLPLNFEDLPKGSTVKGEDFVLKFSNSVRQLWPTSDQGICYLCSEVRCQTRLAYEWAIANMEPFVCNFCYNDYIKIPDNV